MKSVRGRFVQMMNVGTGRTICKISIFFEVVLVEEKWRERSCRLEIDF